MTAQQILKQSRSKGYEVMKLGYLIECNVRNNFPQISCKK